MKGPGGIGKTEIALKYVEEHEQEYGRIIFIDCKKLNNSLEGILESYQKDVPDEKARIPVLINALLIKESEKYLLVIDNVDTPEISNTITNELLPAQSNGDVIITGRYFSGFDEKDTIEIERIRADKGGIEIFEKMLPTEIREKFKKENYENKKAFIDNDLGGIPLAFKQAAVIFPIQNFTIDTFRAQMGNTNWPAMEVFFGVKSLSADEKQDSRTIGKTYEPNIRSIESSIIDMTTLKPGLDIMVRDVLRFFAFFGNLECVTVSKEPISMQSLLEAFKMASGNKIYSTINYEDFKSIFNVIVYQLNQHSLINIQRNDESVVVVATPLTVKWAVQLGYGALVKKETDQIDKEIQAEWSWVTDWTYGMWKSQETYKLEKKAENAKIKLRWFLGACQYSNNIINLKRLDRDSFSNFIGLINYMNESELARCHLVKELNETQKNLWYALRRAVILKDREAYRALLAIPEADMEKLAKFSQDAVQVTKVLFAVLIPNPVIRSVVNAWDIEILVNLGMFFLNGLKMDLAERLFQEAVELSSEQALFWLGKVYYERAKTTKEEGERGLFLQKANTYFNTKLYRSSNNSSEEYKIELTGCSLEEEKKIWELAKKLGIKIDNSL